MAINELRQRVERRLAEINMGAIEAVATVPGLERNYIRDLLEHKKNSFNQNSLDKVAQALRWTVDELLGRASSAPLLDMVSAGELLAPLSQIDVTAAKRIFFNGLGPGEFFALTVEGDSMNKQSPQNSIILVNKAETEPVSGKSYVFEYEGKTTYKLWKASPRSFVPNSTNKTHKTLPVAKSDFRVIGRVKRTVLDL